MLEILREKGLRADDPFDEMIIDAKVNFFDAKNVSYYYLVQMVTNEISERFPMESDGLYEELTQAKSTDPNFISPKISFWLYDLPE